MRNSVDEPRRLIDWIALRLTTAEEAVAAAQALAAMAAGDWRKPLSKAKQRRLENEKKKVDGANRRAEKIGLTGQLTLPQWLETLEHFHWRCAYCQEEFSYEHLDHFFPLSEGRHGTTAYNCVPACRICNRYKSSRNADYWLSSPALLEGSYPDRFRQGIMRVASFVRERMDRLT